MSLWHTQFDAVQGLGEKRSEVYIRYSERVSQLLTQQCTNSAGGLLATPEGRTVR